MALWGRFVRWVESTLAPAWPLVWFVLVGLAVAVLCFFLTRREDRPRFEPTLGVGTEIVGA